MMTEREVNRQTAGHDDDSDLNFTVCAFTGVQGFLQKTEVI